MARKGHGRPASLVQIAGSGTTYPDDGTSPVGSNEWNANRDTTGVIGFTKKTEAKVKVLMRSGFETYK